MDILYDWQFWGVVVGLLAIISGFVIYLLQRNKKRLAYSVLTETPLLSIDEAIKGKIEIKYEKKKIQNIHLVIIRVENTGNVDILSSDFERPLTFSFPNSEILSIEVVGVSPKNLLPEITQEASTISLNPVLLNRTDFIEIKLLFSKYEKTIDANVRIAGVKEIKMMKRSDSMFALLDDPLFKSIAFALLVVPLYSLLDKTGVVTSPIITLVITVIVVFAIQKILR